MNEVCDANGKWLGAHDKSCQREKCKNPKGKLINCFSCQRAFCKPCWKKVSSMLAGMKSAKGFQNCSIEHRPQTQPQTLADCEPLHQQRPRSPIVQSGKPTASLPETPTHSIEQISVPDLDDNNDEPRAIRCAYAAPDPRDVAGNVPPTCKPRKPESLTPSSKRPLEDFISEIENPNSKRGKLTSSISTLSVSQVESSDHVSIPDSQSSLPVSFQDRHGGENIEGQYRSDPNRHKLRDRIMHQLLLDQIQNKKRLLTARQALEHMDGGPGEALDQDGKLIKDRESVVTGDTITSTLSTAQDGREQNSNTVTKVGEAVTIAQGKPKSISITACTAPTPSENTGPVPHKTSDICTPPSDESQMSGQAHQYSSVLDSQAPSASKSNHVPPVPQADHARGPEVVVLASCSQSTSSKSPTPTVPPQNEQFPMSQSSNQDARPLLPSSSDSIDPQVRYAIPNQNHLMHFDRGSNISSNGQECRPQLISQTQQFPVQVNHNYRVPRLSVSSETPRKVCPPHDQLLTPPGSKPSCSSQNEHDSHSQKPPAIPISIDTPKPSQIRNPEQDDSQWGLARQSNSNPSSAPSTHASSESDIEQLPTNQKEIGGGLCAIFNPEAPRVLDVSLLHTFRVHSYVTCVRFSPNGNYVAIGGNRFAQIFDATLGQSVCILPIYPTRIFTGDIYIRSLCFSSDGKFLITASEDMIIRVWNIESKSIHHILEGHEGNIFSLDFASNGHSIASGSDDCTVRLWEMNTVSQRILLKTEREVASVSFSPDSILIAAACLDTCIRVWNTQTGHILLKLDESNGHKDSIFSIAFSPNGRYLISGSLDWTVKMWEIFTPFGVSLSSDFKGGRCIQTFEGHNDIILSVAMTSDGAWILSGSMDNEIHFWNPHTGISQLRIQGHRDSVLSVASSPMQAKNGTLFATGSGDNEAKIWLYTNVASRHIPQSDNTEDGNMTSGNSTIQGRHQSPNLLETSILVGQQPAVVQRTVAQNVLPQPHDPPVIVMPATHVTNASQLEGPGHVPNLSDQPSTSTSIPRTAPVASMARNNSEAATPGPDGSELNSQRAINSNESENAGTAKARPSWIPFLHKIRSFASEGVKLFEKRSSHGVSLVRDEETRQGDQEELDKTRSDIRRIEALYDGILQDLPESEIENFLLMKRHHVDPKRQQLEEISHRVQEDLRVAQERKRQDKMLTRLEGDLKILLPGTISALQNLQAHLLPNQSDKSVESEEAQGF